MKSGGVSNKNIWVILSQIIFVPIYTVIFALSKGLDGVLWVFGKAMDYVGLFFKKVFGGIASFLHIEKREKVEKSHKEHKISSGSKIGDISLLVLKIILLVVFSPVIAVLAVCFLVWLLFFGIGEGIRYIGRRIGLRKRRAKLKVERADREEPAWRRKLSYGIYSITTTVREYFRKHIFVFDESHRSTEEESVEKRRQKSLVTRNTRQRRFIFLMLLFPIAQFLVFWVYVNFNSILMAFRLEQDGEFVYTLHNFKTFFVELRAASGNMMKMVKNSLSFFPVSVCITLPLSFIFSYFLYKKVPGSSIFRVLFYLPSIMSAVSMTMLFRYTVSPIGPLSVLEKALGITPIDFLGSPKYAMGTILFYTVWSGLGYNIVLLSAAVGRIPQELFDAAQIDGAGIFREMISLVLPLTYGTISTLITVSLAHLFTTIGPVILLTNGQHDTNTIASFIYYKVKNSGDNNLAYASAVGLVFTVVGFPIVMLGRKLISVIGDNIEF